MSLQNLLQNYSAQVNSRVEHGEAVSTENSDRKATTMEEHFQHAQDLLEAAGGQISGVAGGYHIGRKLYKKYQEKYAKKEKPGQTEPQPESDSLPAESRPAPVEKTKVSKPSNSLDNIPEEDEEDDDAGADTGAAPDPAAAPGPAAAAPAAPDPAAAAADPAADTGGGAARAGRGVAPDATDLGADTGSSAFDAAMARPAPVVARPAAAPAAAAPDPAAAADTGSTGVGGQDIGTAVTRTGPAIPDAPDVANLGGSIPGGADRPPAGLPDGSVPQGPGGGASGASGDIDTALQDARSTTSDLTGSAKGVLNSIKNKAGNLAKQAGQKLGAVAGEEGGESAGFLTSEGVLDSLGPIGEIGGAVLGLVGLFKSLFHKDPADAGTKAVASTASLVTQASSIDPDALASTQAVVGSVI